MKLKNLALLLLTALIPFIGLGKSKGGSILAIGDMTLEPEDSLTFSLEDFPDEVMGYEVLSEFLPEGVDIVWTGKKFKAPKAGRVKYSKKEEDFVSTSDENPCGLKISINKKTGRVSGSFKVYCAKSEKKLKSYTAKFGGYLGGELTVSVKGGGSFPASLD